MKDGPDISRIAALIGDPARANMLTSLMSGKALTATELAVEAGVSASTTSIHLGKLEDGGLVVPTKQGRHRYYRLTSPDVAEVLEALMGLAQRTGATRVRTGPKDPELRLARVCYDHLAGEQGVRLLDGMLANELITQDGNHMELTSKGQTMLADFGIDLVSLQRLRRPLCRSCLDWSMRRSHLAGALGAALLDRMVDLRWLVRVPDSRVVRFTARGSAEFARIFTPSVLNPQSFPHG
jgi:DNA-binding transcriptional ArsR family regulator